MAEMEGWTDEKFLDALRSEFEAYRELRDGANTL